jgi:WD40 repeat protein
VRKNIAYLDQNNNSVVYKDDENENFTFSIGAEDSGNYDKNRRILKLASLTDLKAIRTCEFSPSGNFFALGTNSSYLKIYDIK